MYLALHVGLQKRFALKLVHPALASSPGFAGRFGIEARALGRLKHPNIVSVTDYGTDSRDGGLHYLVMEALDGQTLADVLRPGTGLSLDRALPLLEALASAVDAAHQQGVLHRDLKPSNVFLPRSQGGSETLKVMDFGIAKLIDDLEGGVTPLELVPPPGPESGVPTLALAGSQATGTVRLNTQAAATGSLADRSEVVGTPPYMSPEVIRAEAPTRAADIYAFGVIAYEILCGRLPFSGDTASVLKAHLSAAPPRPSSTSQVQRDLDEALLAPLSKEIGDRPKSASEAYNFIRRASDIAKKRAWRAAELPRRLILSAVLAVAVTLVAPAGARLDALHRFEGWTLDLRFRALTPRPPDPRLLLVVIDESSLASSPASLADRADEFGEALERVFAAGASRIGVDFVLPDAWRQSELFSRLAMHHADTLTLAAYATAEGEVIGAGCLEGLVSAALGPERASNLLAFVNLQEDADGVTRRARGAFRDREGVERPSWATRVGGATPHPSRFWIDHSADSRLLQRISWRDLPQTLRDHPSQRALGSSWWRIRRLG